MSELLIHSSEDERPYRVKLAEDPYIRGDDKRVVQFWDLTYQNRNGFGDDGQRAGSYSIRTILDSHSPTVGLDMLFGQPYWKIDGASMDAVVEWVLSNERKVDDMTPR